MTEDKKIPNGPNNMPNNGPNNLPNNGQNNDFSTTIEKVKNVANILLS